VLIRGRPGGLHQLADRLNPWGSHSLVESGDVIIRSDRNLLTSAHQMDDHGLAIGAFGVVDPSFHITIVCLGGTAFLIERILDPSRPSSAIGRAGERMLFLSPATPVNADETKSFSVIIRVGVVDLEIDIHPLCVRLHTGDLRWLWRRRTC